MCKQVGCNGELLSTGESITRLSTSWKHRCGSCGHEDWAGCHLPAGRLPPHWRHRTWWLLYL